MRRKLPIYQTEDLELVKEQLAIRAEKYGIEKYEIFDCVKEEVIDVESIKTGYFDGGDSELSESLSENTDFSLYGALGDTTESSSESPD